MCAGPTLAAAKPVRAPGGSGAAAAGSSKPGGSGGGGGGGPKREDGKDEEVELDDSKPGIPEKRFVLQDTLDYSQYYPTTLPLQVWNCVEWGGVGLGLEEVKY